MKRTPPIQIKWKPDKNAKIPVYQQIVQFVYEKVSKGEWPIGTRLPSQRTLAELFEVNRSTIVTAIEELASYGIIEGCYGAGTQIVSNTWSLFLPPSPDWNSYVSSGFFKANNSTIQTINHLEFVPDMVRLGTGEVDPRLFPQKMWKHICESLSQNVTSLGYLEALGLMELREAISHHMETLGIYAPPSCILITSGSLQALQLISVCLLKSGSTIYTEAPTYLKSLQVFQSAGMNLSGVPMDDNGIQFRNLEHLLEKGMRQDSSILYTIPTNHNPTGITMSESRRNDLMEFCTANRLPIIEDGAYQELCYDGNQPTPLKAMDKTGMVIYLGSTSKSLAPGLRIGWIIAAEPIVQRLGDVKMQMDYGASSISQWAFAEFLSSGMYQHYLTNLKIELKHRRDHALSILSRYYKNFAYWNVPNGGFYIWLTIKGNVNMELLFENAVKNKILLNPGAVYDFKHNNSLRLSYAYTSCEEFEHAAITLAKIIQKQLE